MNQPLRSEIFTIEEVEDYLNEYNPFDSMYFSSQKQTIIANAPFADLLDTSTSGSDIGRQVRASLSYASSLGNHRAMVIGSIPFDASSSDGLKVCVNSHKKTEKDPIRLPAKKRISSMVEEVIPSPQPEDFKQQVQSAVDKMHDNKLDKVVLSRALDVTFSSAPDVLGLLRKLHNKNQNAYTFSVPLDVTGSFDERRVLIGASPELLISKQGRRISAFPLAGSEPRLKDPDLDRKQSEKLFESRKDRYEHDLVIQAIEKALKPFCKWIHIPKEPSLMSTQTMWHLGTPIEGELLSSDIWSIDLALALHPTPAVGGYPKLLATSEISKTESYSRDHYAGTVGWCDAKGDGEWAVTIRCAQVKGKAIRLYAGAGIVKDSSAQKELDETSAKFRTMLNAMELDV